MEGLDEARLVELVHGYARRVYPAVLAQHAGESVSSPLGVWVLLAACLVAAEGDDRAVLEQAVGCSPAEAGVFLHAFLEEPPPALHAAIALWFRSAVRMTDLDGWLRLLPSKVEAGQIPTPSEADAWADRHTLGLIKSFPGDLSELEIVLASAVATRVSWEHPFELADASDRFGEQSPWRNLVRHALVTELTHDAALFDSDAAGIVAVNGTVAREDLTVICVSGEPGAGREAVIAAAHEVAGDIARGIEPPAHSLFDVPLGDGHSWTLIEQERPAYDAGQRFETIAEVALPAWKVNSTLGLLDSISFGAAAAVRTLARIAALDGPPAAQQVALAKFDRYGFEAAAITTFAVASAAFAPPTEVGIERVARLRFDHPFAAIAVTGKPARAASRSRFHGLPLFTAWIDTPTEAE